MSQPANLPFPPVASGRRGPRRAGGRSIVCAVLAGLALGPFADAQDPPAAPSGANPPDHREPSASASCVLRIAFDQRFPIDANAAALEAIVMSNAIAARAAEEVFSAQQHSQPQYGIGLRALTPPGRGRFGDGVLLAQLDVEFYSPQVSSPDAERFISALCRRLQSAVEQIGTDDHQAAEANVVRVQAELAETRRALEETMQKRAQMLQEVGASDLDRKRIGAELESVAQNIYGIEMERSTAEARQKAILVNISQIQAQLEKQSISSPTLKELETLLELREREVARVRKLLEAGSGTESDLAGAMESVVAARAEVAKERAALRRAAGGELIESLNSKLVELSIETAASQARIAELRKREAALRERLKLAEAFERQIERPQQMYEDREHELSKRLSELQDELRSLRKPDISIIGEMAKP